MPRKKRSTRSPRRQAEPVLERAQPLSEREEEEISPPPGEEGLSPTAAAGEALQSGVTPVGGLVPDPEIPGLEGEKMRVGDPDVSPLSNEYSGEEVPGASTPTPDQNRVDDIGRAYGIEEEDTGTLKPSADLLEERDRHRRE
jgi:Family of unknown function (DUF6335)